MGALRRLNSASKVNRHTDRQTDGRTNPLIGPEARCFENIEPIRHSNLHRLIVLFEAILEVLEGVFDLFNKGLIL